MRPNISHQTSEFDCLVKVVIVGESAVGKTNILLRFVSGDFKPNHMTTIGVDFKIKTMTVGSNKIKMQIWDTAGQERFKSIPKQYFSGAAGVILVFSLVDRISFQKMQGWVSQFQQSMSTITKIIVGNKSDLPNRQVTAQQGRRLAQKYNCMYMQSSARDNVNIKEIFQYLAQKMMDNIGYVIQNDPLKAPNLSQRRCSC